jgi:hypothetical protein
MSASEIEQAPTATVPERPRRLRALLFSALAAQYTLIALGVGLPLAATLRFVVTPQIVAKFEALTTALGR